MTDKKWVRRCDECRSLQYDKEPPKAQPAYDKWAEHKCRKCGSAALDYGKWYTPVVSLEIPEDN